MENTLKIPLTKILNDLDENQRSCAEYDITKPLLISAPPGSGKTKTLLARICNLLSNGVHPEHILLLTFTKKAAKEMNEKMESLVSYNVHRRMKKNISTIHSFCYRKIVAPGNPQRLGYKSLRNIVYGPQQLKIIKSLFGLKSNSEANDLQKKIGFYKKEPVKEEESRNVEILREKIKVYDSYLKEKCLIDYTDMLLLAIRLFQENPGVLEDIRKHYKFILVDEYQDTSTIQVKVLLMIIGEVKQITVVGDENQKIYSFRNIPSDLFINFQTSFQCERKELVNNYRSTSNIVKACDCLMNFASKNSKINTISIRGLGEKIQICLCDENTSEEEFVSYLCHVLVNPTKPHVDKNVSFILPEKFFGFSKYNISYSDIAVLCRKKSPLNSFERQFKNDGIPYIRSGDSSLYQREDVRDIISYLNLIIGSNSPLCNDDFINVFNKPKEVIKSENCLSFARFQKISCFDMMKKMVENGEYVEKKIFFEDIDKLRFMYFKEKKSISDIMKFICFESCYTEFREYLIKMDKEKIQKKKWYYKKNNIPFDVDSEDESRDNNLKCLCVDSKRFTNLSDFVSFCNKDVSPTKNSVTISSIHVAKGREWKVVFCVDCCSGTMPIINAIDIEEERRICYVGMSRSKDLCFMTTKTNVTPSPFLFEINEKFLEKNVIVSIDNNYRIEKRTNNSIKNFEENRILPPPTVQINQQNTLINPIQQTNTNFPPHQINPIQQNTDFPTPQLIVNPFVAPIQMNQRVLFHPMQRRNFSFQNQNQPFHTFPNQIIQPPQQIFPFNMGGSYNFNPYSRNLLPQKRERDYFDEDIDFKNKRRRF